MRPDSGGDRETALLGMYLAFTAYMSGKIALSVELSSDVLYGYTSRAAYGPLAREARALIRLTERVAEPQRGGEPHPEAPAARPRQSRRGTAPRSQGRAR